MNIGSFFRHVGYRFQSPAYARLPAGLRIVYKRPMNGLWSDLNCSATFGCQFFNSRLFEVDTFTAKTNSKWLCWRGFFLFLQARSFHRHEIQGFWRCHFSWADAPLRFGLRQQHKTGHDVVSIQFEALAGNVCYQPSSTPQLQYDNAFVFNALDVVNNMRNRIAHHEPICFGNTGSIDTHNVMYCYAKIMQLFQWMDIDAVSLLYGVNHVADVCDKVMKIWFFAKNACVIKKSLYFCSVKSRQSLSNQTAGYCFFIPFHLRKRQLQLGFHLAWSLLALSHLPRTWFGPLPALPALWPNKLRMSFENSWWQLCFPLVRLRVWARNEGMEARY